MKIFHEEFIEFFSSKKKWVVGLLLLLFFVGLKYGFYYLNYDKYHLVVTLATFAIYFTVLTYLTAFLIKKKKILLVNFSILFILLFVAELTFYFVLGMPKKEWKDYASPDLDADHIGTHLGHVPWADSVWHDVKKVDDKVIFDTHYSIDKLNRRITPGYDSTKSKYAAFFGCSIGFGFGLKDDQTIPFFVQQKAEDYNSYNYAYNGWGPHHMLARLEHKDLSKEVVEKDGVGVYIFFWGHIRRVICDMKTYTGWGHTMPYYYLDDGEVKRDGNFANGRTLVSGVYERLDRSYLWNYVNVNLPTETREDHLILTVEIIKKAKETYKKQFGNDNFVVVIHPSDWVEFTPERNEQFKNILTERGIKYFDYSESLILDNEHTIVGDGHPNEKSAEKLAKMLVKDLGLNN